jgi:hypothetical protein
VLDGAGFHRIEAPAKAYLEGIGSGPAGALCVAALSTTYRLRGGKLIPIGAKNQSHRCTIAPDGKVWTLLNAVDFDEKTRKTRSYAITSVFNGTTWSRVDERDETGKDILADAAGRVWVAYFRLTRIFEGTTARAVDTGSQIGAVSAPSIFVARSGAVFLAQAFAIIKSTGTGFAPVFTTRGPFRAALGTDDVLHVIESSQLTHIDGSGARTTERSALPQPGATAADGSGRLWLGSSRSLIVRDAAGTMRHFSPPELAGEIVDMHVQGGGPELPLARVVGRLVAPGGSPVAGAPVEMCISPNGFAGRDETPCQGALWHASSTTAADGRFTLDSVPLAQSYFIAHKVGAKWSFAPNVCCDDMAAGKTSDVGEVTVSR